MYHHTRPACPLDALPDLLYNAACEIGQTTEAPAEVLLTDAIAVAAMAVCLRHDVSGFDGRTMPTAIFTAALARSGVGKGQAMRAFFKTFKEDTKARLLQELRTDEPAKAEDELVLEEITLPALMDRLQGIGKGCSFQLEEGERFIPTLFKLCGILTQLWSGDPPVKRLVKGLRRIAIDARLCIGFRIQPFLFYEALAKDGRRTYEQGLWPRFLLANYDPQRFPTPQPDLHARAVGSGHNDRLQAVIGALVEQAKLAPANADRQVVALSRDAAVYMRMLKEDIKHHAPPHYTAIQPSVDRAWENTLRLAAVFHVICQQEGQISQEMVERAWTIVAWSLTQHHQLFVEGICPTPKAAVPVLTSGARSRRASPAEDARRLLECILHTRQLRHGEGSFLDDVAAQSDLAPVRFRAALQWLERKKQVEVRGDDPCRLIRVLEPYAHSHYQASGTL